MNLLDNPGFERVTTAGTPEAWTVLGGTARAVDDVALSGDRSVLLSDPHPDHYAGLRSSRVVVRPGEKLRASVQVRNESATSTLVLEYWDAAGTRIATRQAATVETGDWVELVTEAVAPAAAVEASVLLFRGTPETGRAHFDDARLVRVV